MHRSAEAHEALLQTARNVFAPQAFDPQREESKLQEIVRYALDHGGVEGPVDLLRFMSAMDRHARRIYPGMPMIDALWLTAQGAIAAKAQMAMMRGP